MDEKKLSKPQAAGIPSAAAPVAAVDAFLSSAKKIGPAATAEGRARLVFALDATMSRQPTWDLACKVQAQMFEAADKIGGLAVQLIYFRGFDECRSSKWVIAPAALTTLMNQIACRGGHTQIGRVLRHVRNEARTTGVKAMVYVGDAMEEPVDDLCAVAGELGLLGVKA
ncbi:MAG TPA: VWA domain-containing protein, partial [Beijerinckiaceae bacterium]|nr:VWA domain-containing protein [Beijerinckiaceae bacterium]